MRTCMFAVAAMTLAATAVAQSDAAARRAGDLEGSAIFRAPVRLEADGAPIDIGKLSNFAHAGPALADVDGDGDRDLLVGDFPGHFWLFDNVGTDADPDYRGKGRFEAGGQAAKTPVY